MCCTWVAAFGRIPIHYTSLNLLALREGADVGTDARNGLNRRTARAKQEALADGRGWVQLPSPTALLGAALDFTQGLQLRNGRG
ncbi:hypothetical protein WJX77_000128 [Trebouxia sp. C0004]